MSDQQHYIVPKEFVQELNATKAAMQQRITALENALRGMVEREFYVPHYFAPGDSYCPYCPYSDAHEPDCPVVLAKALLGEDGK